jgi:hypothetical protein
MQKIPRSQLSAYQRPLQGGKRIIKQKTSRYQGLAGQYQQAIDKANAANESRYQQILGGYDDLSKRVTGELANAGNMERKDINRQYNSMGSDVYQRLVNRGFGNSSLLATMRMGTERERSDALARSYERAAQLRANADMQLSQAKMGVMERRTDMGPDPQQLIALSQGLGRAGYGQPRYARPIGYEENQAIQQQQQLAMMQQMAMMQQAQQQPSPVAMQPVDRRRVYGVRSPGPAAGRRAYRAAQRERYRERIRARLGAGK